MADRGRITYNVHANRHGPSMRWVSTRQSNRGKHGKSKKVKNLTTRQLEDIIDKRSIETQKTQVQYFVDFVNNQNPAEGILSPVVFPIQPRGMDQLLPNYGSLTEGKRKIYLEYINLYIIFNENDLEVNDTKRNFIRYFVVEKDDETSASQQNVIDMFKSSGTGTVVEESLSAVVPYDGTIFKSKDSGWKPYNAQRDASLSTGAVVTDIPNFVYPFRKYKINFKINREYQIADNGTLIDWKQKTMALFFTGLATSAPDCSIYYHMYYKVLA